jgi:hypothetical protein
MLEKTEAAIKNGEFRQEDVDKQNTKTQHNAEH